MGRYKTFNTHCGISPITILMQFLLHKKFTWHDVGSIEGNIY